MIQNMKPSDYIGKIFKRDLTGTSFQCKDFLEYEDCFTLQIISVSVNNLTNKHETVEIIINDRDLDWHRVMDSNDTFSLIR